MTDNDKAGGRYQAAADLRAEVERLRAELDDAKTRLSSEEEQAATRDAQRLVEELHTARAKAEAERDALREERKFTADDLNDAVLMCRRLSLAESAASLAERDAVIGELRGAAEAVMRHRSREGSASHTYREWEIEMRAKLDALSAALALAAPHAARGAAVIREAREAGAKAAYLDVAEHNEEQARSLRLTGHTAHAEAREAVAVRSRIQAADALHLARLAAEGKEAGQ